MRILDFVVRVIMRLELMLFILPWSHAVQAADAANSLTALTSVWTDQNGVAFNWKELSGKVSLVSMVYTSCEQTCPLIMSELSAIQKSLPEDQQKKIQVLVFSFDPQRDTKERLAAYAKERKLPGNWRLLRASEDDVQELAAVLGVRVKKLQTGGFAHSNVITVLDQKGQVRYQQTELFKDRPETSAMIKTLLFSVN